MKDTVIKILKEIAEKECVYDNMEEDDIIDDWAGGNIDDAFSLGHDAGEVELARSILDLEEIEFVKKDK